MVSALCQRLMVSKCLTMTHELEQASLDSPTTLERSTSCEQSSSHWAYNFKQIYDVGRSEINQKVTRLCVDGGVSHNNFVMQLACELLGQKLQRPKDVDMTVYGAVYVAGLASGFWESREDIRKFWELDRKFEPEKSAKEREDLLSAYTKWQQAVQRCLEWYKKSED